jgi:rRNA maturation endonuclease Nob1
MLVWVVAITIIAIILIVIVMMVKDFISTRINVKNTFNTIIDGVKDVTTTAVSKCPSCGANVKNDSQKYCEYCGSLLPRENRFKKR